VDGVWGANPCRITTVDRYGVKVSFLQNEKKKRPDGPMQARLRVAMRIARAELPGRLGTLVCIETFAKGMKSASYRIP
jgi:hypothetical protein